MSKKIPIGERHSMRSSPRKASAKRRRPKRWRAWSRGNWKKKWSVKASRRHSLPNACIPAAPKLIASSKPRAM